MKRRIAFCLALTGWLLAGKAPAQTLPLPPRPPDSPGGARLIPVLAPLPLKEREERILGEIIRGNAPEFLRRLTPVNLTAGTNTATIFVTPDYLALGSDTDYFLTPLSPAAAQRLADSLDCTLPTRKMVDAIYAAASVKLAPSNLPPSAAMTTIPVFAEHNRLVQTQRAAQLSTRPPGALTAGHKKDVVLTARLAGAPGKVAIYGWHRPDGTPIQPLYLGHTASWVDYSHGLRLVQNVLIVNGQRSTVAAVLTNGALANLLSDEGVINPPRYPTNAVEQAAVKTRAGLLPGFQASPHFGEQTLDFTFEPGVKIHLNAPAAEQFSPARPVRLVLYALPNGNTIAQTVGRQVQPGDDWHFGIQHIGAQTRFVRGRLLDGPLVVACLETQPLSWPAWRKQHDPANQVIPKIIAAVRQRLPDGPVKLTLTGHSGGGSFTFGFLNAMTAIPDDVERIAFLDSNYAYDRAAGHADKLTRWLQADGAHHLAVFAYHDAVALLNGQPFVSAAGGTWGRSHAMLDDLAAAFPFSKTRRDELQIHSALAGRVKFFLRENPERVIYHTVQVEQNGFIHALLAGTAEEERGYTYLGPRAYDPWIQPE